MRKPLNGGNGGELDINGGSISIWRKPAAQAAKITDGVIVISENKAMKTAKASRIERKQGGGEMRVNGIKATKMKYLKYWQYQKEENENGGSSCGEGAGAWRKSASAAAAA